MSDTEAQSAEPQATPHRSRWRRFVPSMGWKAFWSEIVIVVLGVAIALIANEAVQDWNWRGKVADAEIRLRSDAASVFGWSAEQYATKPCVDAQLDRMASVLMESGTTLTPIPRHEDATNPARPRFVVRHPARPWRFSVWDALEADGTASHFSQDRQNLFGYLNETVATLLMHRNEASRLGGSLTALSYPLPLDAGVRGEFLERIESLRWQTTALANTSWQVMVRMKRAGLVPPESEVLSQLEQSGTLTFCKEQGLPWLDWRTAPDPSSAATVPANPPAPR